MHMVPPDAEPLPQTLLALAEADIITIGPGSLFTSLVPNLLVCGIPEAIAKSRALKVFIYNLMTEANESLNITPSQHIKPLDDHPNRPVFDHALATSVTASDHMKATYAPSLAH